MIKNQDDLFQQMSEGAIVITPNNRLSNQLTQHFYTHKQNLSIDKPSCLPYQAFLNKLFDILRHDYPHSNHPLVLSQLQQRHLWQSIIATQQDYPCSEGLLYEIQQAWADCQHWLIDINNPIFLHSAQTRQFQTWQKTFQDRLKQLNAITQEQLVRYILTYPELLHSKTIIWVCFDDFTPQQVALQNMFSAQGYQQIYYDLPPKPLTAQCYAAVDQQDESLQMIQWLKARLLEGDNRIGVIIPELQTQHQSLQRLLQRHIPQDQFNISLGRPLTDYSLVTHALAILNLNHRIFTHHQVKLLLHSPYLFAAQSEMTLRAQLMHSHGVMQEANIPFDNLILELNHSAPKLSHILKKTIHYPDKASVEEWINHFKTRLSNFGFPGETPLSSAMYQCFQRFMSLFDELLQLSSISSSMSMETALNTLLKLAQSTIFQTQKPTACIQIQGLLEASGCTFDSVWVCGLTDQCLPQKTKLSAFIPIALQRDRKMPHAVIAREFQLSQQLLQRLDYGSQRCIFSYSRFNADMPNMPSSLLLNLPEYTPIPRELTIIQTHLIENQEHYHIPVSANEKIFGGTALLANQAKCPFRAFAAHRLHIKSILKPSTGLDATERGQLLHGMMEKIWAVIGSQDKLNTLTITELNVLINNTMDELIKPLSHKRALSFPPLVQQIERKRLHRLVNANLEWEKQRPAFSIEALEKTFTISLAGLEFNVRVDRLDRLPDGTKWVIDYKTSIPTNKPWLELRPEEPQLLLYALLDEHINALLFIQLKAGQLTCSGLSEESLSIKGINALKKNERWMDYKEQWSNQLTGLAEEFKTGSCPPKPARNTTCTLCDYQNLCRIESIG